MNINRLSIIAISMFLSFTAEAQKITLGSATTKDGGEYQGEMLMGKPNGKGKAVYKNGNWYDYDRVPYRYKLMLQNYHYMQYNEVFDRENTLENVFSLPDVKLAMAPAMISRELQ